MHHSKDGFFINTHLWSLVLVQGYKPGTVPAAAALFFYTSESAGSLFWCYTSSETGHAYAMGLASFIGEDHKTREGGEFTRGNP